MMKPTFGSTWQESAPIWVHDWAEAAPGAKIIAARANAASRNRWQCKDMMSYPPWYKNWNSLYGTPGGDHVQGHGRPSIMKNDPWLSR
jgi:hypothetical protein